jgi:hypothetical protein
VKEHEGPCPLGLWKYFGLPTGFPTTAVGGCASRRCWRLKKPVESLEVFPQANSPVCLLVERAKIKFR